MNKHAICIITAAVLCTACLAACAAGESKHAAPAAPDHAGTRAENNPADQAPQDPTAVLYDGTEVRQSDLVMGVGYQFDDYGIVGPFDLAYAPGTDGTEISIPVNRGATYGGLLDTYGDLIDSGEHIGEDEYIQMLGFSAVSVAEDTVSWETKSTFSRRGVAIETAESFDVMQAMDVPKIDNIETTDVDGLIETLGRPRFAAVNWKDDEEYRVDYYWDMGGDRYLTVLRSGAVKFQSGEFLLRNRPMFTPFLHPDVIGS